MKFIKCHMTKSLTVILDSNEEIDKDFDEIIEELMNGCPLEGYLFLPSDKPNIGNPIIRNVSRDKYLKNPTKYGILVYKNLDDEIIFE